MTFIRKFINALNMDNWKSDTAYTNDFHKPNKAVNLDLIHSFWKLHPQVYHEDYCEATIEEYLLYGKTLMLWRFTSASPLKSSFPIYYDRECNISNPKQLQSQLVQEGYLILASIKDTLSSYKVPELKLMAEGIGCSKSGRKSEIIDRILKHLDKEAIDTIKAQNKLYVLSDKGHSFLQDNYDYVELHRHAKYGIPLYEFNKNRFPDKYRRTFTDNAYTIISQRIYKNCLHYYYHMMEQDYRALYEIALSEHMYDIALDSYLRSLYLASCCLLTAQYTGDSIAYVADHHITFTAHSAPPLTDFVHLYNSSFVENIFNDLSLPPSFMSEKEFMKMIEEMISSTAFDYDKYNKLIISRLKKYSKY